MNKKSILYIGVLSLLIAAVFSSCTSQRNGAGCPATRGMGGMH